MNFSVRVSNAKHTKHVIARALACGMTLVLASCGIPDLRQPEPPPDLPASYSGPTSADVAEPVGCNKPASEENSAQLSIQEFFNDPLLLCLIEQSLANNRELKVLEEEVQIARNDILARRGAYLPFIGFRADAGVEKNSLFTPLGAVEENVEYLPGKNFPSPLGNFLLGFNFFWQLDIWRELRNARDAATERYLAASERRNYFATRLVAEVAENYYRLIALDKRIDTLGKTIGLQTQSLETAKARKEAARDTALAIQRFQAEVRKNQSEKLIVQQEIVQVENRINVLVNRFPQPVERVSPADFFELTLPMLSVGLPAQLLQYRADIRQAERELVAAGLDIKVARARFFPRVDLSAGVGYQAFNPKYLFNPEALFYNAAGSLVTPLINKKAIQAEYRTANAKQLQSVYEYQRTILNAYTEVVNRVSTVANYSRSIELKKQQLASLDEAVDTASKLFQNARVEYVEVLLAQRDRLEASMVLIETKKEQLAAIVNAYQALGGAGQVLLPNATAQCSTGTIGAVTETITQPAPAPAGEMLPPPRLAPATDLKSGS